MSSPLPRALTLLALVVVALLALSNTEPTCVPVNPVGNVCVTSLECADLVPPEDGCPGAWSCVDAQCVWQCPGPGCTQDADCMELSPANCCPPPPWPCAEEPVLGVAADEAEVQQWITDNCSGPEPPICPDYAPPRCWDCLDVQVWTPRCGADGACFAEPSIDCEALCAAAAKPEGAVCPFINAADLITPEAAAACDCCGINQQTSCDAEPGPCPQGFEPNSDGDCWVDCVRPTDCKHQPFIGQGSCDDGFGADCLMEPPACEGISIVAVMNGCYECVIPFTCLPVGSEGSCDTDPAICMMMPPVCTDGLIVAQQDGCFVCVDPTTCAPSLPLEW